MDPAASAPAGPVPAAAPAAPSTGRVAVLGVRSTVRVSGAVAAPSCPVPGAGAASSAAVSASPGTSMPSAARNAVSPGTASTAPSTSLRRSASAASESTVASAGRSRGSFESMHMISARTGAGTVSGRAGGVSLTWASAIAIWDSPVNGR